MAEAGSWNGVGVIADPDPDMDLENIGLSGLNHKINPVLDSGNRNDFEFFAFHSASEVNGSLHHEGDHVVSDGDLVDPEFRKIMDDCDSLGTGEIQRKIVGEGEFQSGDAHMSLLGYTMANKNAADQDMPTLSGGQPLQTSRAKTDSATKIGTRFPKEAVGILKSWLSSHSKHPYPNDDEKEMLQRRTGLNKTQVANWLANARRRSKVRATRSTSPHPELLSPATPIDIRCRRGTPPAAAEMSMMGPLQRWVDSPPENEPASVAAIARAITASSSSRSSSRPEHSFGHGYTDDSSGRSIYNQSSASSLGTSRSSSRSLSSVNSHSTSRASIGSFGLSGRRPRRRRRSKRSVPKRTQNSHVLTVPLRTYQCTFCTETFHTKYDWQRHEKSLHLSLERWVCSPEGPRVLNPDTGRICCTFCGEDDPDVAHLESHNYLPCQEKIPEERTFYRKDHLRQHLKLVHDVKFLDWAMKPWKVSITDIRSRCGFCGKVMDTWTARASHLSGHFKAGSTMADWKGDWGFETPVLRVVENSIPPYLIHDERNSPLPYMASHAPAESPRNAYELIKMELLYYATGMWEAEARMPSDEELQLEACRVIFASEGLSLRDVSTQSWLRDLIMASDQIATQAKFGQLRGQAENLLSTLRINGKDNLFESCPLESQLREFVCARCVLGLTIMDYELQEEACKIVGLMEEASHCPLDSVANWTVRLINSSTGWLASFRRRANLSLDGNPQSSAITDSFHDSRWERELRDDRNQSTDDCQEGLHDIRRRDESNGPISARPQTTACPKPLPRAASANPSHSIPHYRDRAFQSGEEPSGLLEEDDPLRASAYFLNGTNWFRQLSRQLARYVFQAMSPNNPNQHVPTDEELQNQARWILYDDDDPWIRTAADNAEWLLRFKREVGLIKESQVGLGTNSSSL